MKLKQTVTKPIEEIVDIFCNKCGMSCKGHVGNFNGLIEAKVSGGYDSTHLSDGDCYAFSLCESCLIQIINKFKLNAKVGNYLFAEENMPDFDRHDYFPEGAVLWEDYTEEQKKEMLSGIGSSMEEYVSHLSRSELIIWLYDLENDPQSFRGNAEEYIGKIKKILGDRRS